MTQSSMPAAIKRPLKLASIALVLFLGFAATWASTAQIATTVRVPGLIVSDRPSHQIQHPRGGQIGEVLVTLHQKVREGDLLFTLDMADQILQRDTLLARRDHILAEMTEISPRLMQNDLPVGSEAEITPVTASFVLQDVNLAHRISELRVRRDAAVERLDAKIRENSARIEMRDMAVARLARLEPLGESGVMSDQTLDQLRQSILNSEAIIATSESQIISLEQEIEATSLRMQVLHSDHRKVLAERQLRHQVELQEVEGRIARLSHLIDQADVHASTSGQITDLPFHTNGMVAGTGATLATITEPLQDAEIELQIPTHYVDQTRVDQTGLLTITGLPQRSAPVLHMTVTAIADEPVRDPQGNPIHYLARGLIEEDDLATAQLALGDRFNLSVGMPVSAALEGDKVTFLSYLTAPLTQIFQGAFED